MARTADGYAPGRARREQILDAAIEAFGRSGFHSATLADIAEACGITRAGLLHHFGSKEALLAAVLERRDATDRAAFEAAVSASISPFQAILDITTGNARTPGLTALYTVLSAEATSAAHPAHAFFRRLYANLVEDFSAALRQAQRRGEVDATVDVDALARELVALKDGLALQSLLLPAAGDLVPLLADAITRMTGVRVEPR
jgi:AcrR family transcriptional regulator